MGEIGNARSVRTAIGGARREAVRQSADAHALRWVRVTLGRTGVGGGDVHVERYVGDKERLFIRYAIRVAHPADECPLGARRIHPGILGGALDLPGFGRATRHHRYEHRKPVGRTARCAGVDLHVSDRSFELGQQRVIVGEANAASGAAVLMAMGAAAMRAGQRVPIGGHIPIVEPLQLLRAVGVNLSAIAIGFGVGAARGQLFQRRTVNERYFVFPRMK